MHHPAPAPRHRTGNTRDLIFDYICQFKAAHDGNTPSIHDIARACHIARSTVDYHLRMLEREGRIVWNLHQRRAIEITGAVWLPPDHPLADAAR